MAVQCGSVKSGRENTEEERDGGLGEGEEGEGVKCEEGEGV